MPDRPRPNRPRTHLISVALAAALFLATTLLPEGANAYPLAPVALDRQLLSNLTAPSVGPGGSSSVSFRLLDPPTFFALSAVVLTFELYALNGYPGDAVGPLPVANAPALENGTASGPEVNVTVASLSPGGSYNGSVAVVTSAATPAGTYAVRTQLSFVANHSTYLFRSRGWFSASDWANATTGAGGTATINASRLGVSGVVPETAVYVAPSGWPVALGALVALGLILAGIGAWLFYRRGPGSSAGASNDPAPGATNAPSALGRSRTSPGDSRSS